MATPPDSPIEDVVFEIEPSRVPKHRPVALEDLCRQTKFTRQEIRVMYRGFKQRNKLLLRRGCENHPMFWRDANKKRGARTCHAVLARLLCQLYFAALLPGNEVLQKNVI
ncbi:hypothetical protein B566_EDAN008521 [Ephemera danica]|nr:hypothetical protein B566_EDAN008521 [Ephemera danica]